MYGNDQYHLHLRLLVSLEIIDFKVCYDIDHPRYDDHVNDNRIVYSSYETPYANTTSIGGYVELLNFFAMSAALGEPIFYYPPTQLQNLSDGFRRTMCGRIVWPRRHPDVTVMWSCAMKPPRGSYPNHFCVLQPKVRQHETETLTPSFIEETYNNITAS